MRRRRRFGLPFCALLGACLWVAPGLADEGGGEPADTFASLKALSASDLEEYRAGQPVASNTLSQTVSNELTAETVTGGDITFGEGAFAGQALSVNLLNSGNNVAMQAAAAMIVNIIEE